MANGAQAIWIAPEKGMGTTLGAGQPYRSCEQFYFSLRRAQFVFIHSSSTSCLRPVRHQNEKIFCAIPKPRLTRGFCP